MATCQPAQTSLHQLAVPMMTMMAMMLLAIAIVTAMMMMVMVIRGARTAIPQLFRQQFGSSSAAAPQLLCITSAAALQLFFITSAVVPQHLRSSGTPPQGAFFLPSPVEKEKPTTARGRHGQFSASIGIGGCRREARALSVVPPSRRPLRSNNRRQQRRRRRRSCFLRARRGGGGVLSWISQLTRTDSSHYLSWRM